MILHHRCTQQTSSPIQSNADQPSIKPYLLFDAGGTLIFPDQDFLIQEARTHGVELSYKQLYVGYYRLIHRLDCQARTQGHFPNLPWPRRYASDLFETLGMVNSSTQAIARAADAREKKSLWTFTFDWVRETLSQLEKQGYGMSVISNSNGRTTETFSDLDLADYFEAIISSWDLRVKKPDPGIFEIALNELELQPANVLYIGDIFEVDVVGANRAGIGAVHLDPLDLYIDRPGVHLHSVAELPSWLEQYAAAPEAFDLFPTRDPAPHPAFAVKAQIPASMPRAFQHSQPIDCGDKL
jgi:putative hydrolase of the HAD superfamily